MNASNGVKLWSFTTGKRVSSSPAIANGVVYIGSVNGNFYALNASTGDKLWSFATGAVWIPRLRWRMASSTSAPTDEDLYALNASTGAELWSYQFAQPGCCSSQSSPLL